MADYTVIPDANLEPGKPARSVDALALRDNPIAIAEGAPGAPRVRAAALHADLSGIIGATIVDLPPMNLGTVNNFNSYPLWQSGTSNGVRGTYYDTLLIGSPLFRVAKGADGTINLTVEVNLTVATDDSPSVRLIVGGTVAQTISVANGGNFTSGAETFVTRVVTFNPVPITAAMTDIRVQGTISGGSGNDYLGLRKVSPYFTV